MFKRFNRYFLLNKRERNGIVILSGLCVLILLIQKIYIEVPGNNEVLSYQFNIENSKELNETEQKKFAHTKNHQRVREHLFYFDPNTANSADLSMLGFNNKLIQRIEKYRSKGGKFLEPKDLEKIYGIDKILVSKLIPFVIIHKPELISKTESTNPVTPNIILNKTISINKADTSVFKSLGVEALLSKKIVKFRNYLGGFYSILQLKETIGMTDSCFNRINNLLTCDSSHIHKLNVNLSDARSLGKHPYLNYRQASAIIEYRNRHGDFSDLDAVYNSGVFSPDEWKKIKPYLSL